jgi:hypothetical protein
LARNAVAFSPCHWADLSREISGVFGWSAA